MYQYILSTYWYEHFRGVSSRVSGFQMHSMDSNSGGRTPSLTGYVTACQPDSEALGLAAGLPVLLLPMWTPSWTDSERRIPARGPAEQTRRPFKTSSSYRNRNGPARPSAAGRTRPPGHSRSDACAAGAGGARGDMTDVDEAL